MFALFIVLFLSHDAVSFPGIQGNCPCGLIMRGLVRGGDTALDQDGDHRQSKRVKMMEAVESYIDGLQNGSEDLGLVRLKDAKYQAKVEEQKNIFRS